MVELLTNHEKGFDKLSDRCTELLKGDSPDDQATWSQISTEAEPFKASVATSMEVAKECLRAMNKRSKCIGKDLH